MSKLEDILGNCITEFNQIAKLPNDKVDIHHQLRIVVELYTADIKRTLLEIVDECNTDNLQTDMIDYSNLVEKIEKL